MKNLFVLSFLCLISLKCSDKIDQPAACIDSVLEAMNMVPYDGRQIGCEFYLVMYEYDDANYFITVSHCAAIVPHVLDCNGNDICGELPEWCDAFFSGAEEVRIVGISE